ncbi:hypothetical protein [Roseomonas sp. CECT 9278]|uniref:hypothetical protein n=1 Tax=Roseomonas sp. CECT 9278 TaxID=2845823 RepID=UPI001E62B122|nr:hypothetical protein [Roseomonas sp. CECT 9278]CAH0150458.1 hypothetical protein ROS9278_00706 [Roseomonas sp. CECT 9278]
MIRPRMLSVAIADWPPLDRQALQRAVAPVDSLFDEEGGGGAHLSDAAVGKLQEEYGVWLSYLGRSGQLEPDLSPAKRVTKSRLNGWISDQRSRGNRDATVLGRLRALHAILRLMVPDADVDFILRPRGVPLRKVLRPVSRPTTVIDPRILLTHVLALFAEGKSGKSYAQGRTAIRDAALLGLLAAHAPRIASIGVMELGTHIRRVGDGYQLDFGERDTKTGQPLSYDINPELVPILDHYIMVTRPGFGAGRSTAKLWLGTRGQPLNKRDLTKIVLRRTKAWLGVARGPHWFRKCIRSFASNVAPELALDAAVMLGHSPQTSINNYAKATAAEAIRRHGAGIERERDRTWSLAASAYGWRDPAPAKPPRRRRSGDGTMTAKEDNA